MHVYQPRLKCHFHMQVSDLLGYGSGGRDRTYDQLINSQLLYR